MSSNPVKAKRGDLVIVSRTVRDSFVSRADSERIEHSIGVVASVTREGFVKAFRDRNDENARPLDRIIGLTGWSIVPAARIDVAAAMKAAADHTWPSGHPWMPFDTLDEVRAALKPCLLDQS